MKHVKENIISALSLVEREGIKKLVSWLHNGSDYFTAPSSTQFHSNYEGGLAKHSWNVFDLLVKKNEEFQLMYPHDTLTICGLLHDLCKVGYYKLVCEDPTDAQMKYLNTLTKGKKLPSVSGKMHKDYVSKLINYYKNGGEEPEYTEGSYVVDDVFPVGHGEKSVFMIQQFIKLYDEEIAAIRWHMIAFDAGVHFNYPSGFPFRQSLEKYPLATVLFTADFEASNILERKDYEKNRPT